MGSAGRLQEPQGTQR